MKALWGIPYDPKDLRFSPSDGKKECHLCPHLTRSHLVEATSLVKPRGRYMSILQVSSPKKYFLPQTPQLKSQARKELEKLDLRFH